MSFIKAEKIVKFLHSVCLVLLIGYLMVRYNNPTLGWICFGGVFVLAIICFPISWKYMRCPYCNHVIPAFRLYGGDGCNACGKPFSFNSQGYLIKVKEEKPAGKGTAPKKKKKKK